MYFVFINVKNEEVCSEQCPTKQHYSPYNDKFHGKFFKISFKESSEIMDYESLIIEILC
jgi:hypothetical protein